MLYARSPVDLALGGETFDTQCCFHELPSVTLLVIHASGPSDGTMFANSKSKQTPPDPQRF